MIGSYRLNTCCAYCNNINENVLYEPFEENCIYYCKSCKKPNFITFQGMSKKVEDVTKDDVKDSIIMELLFNLEEEEVEKISNAIMKRIERCKTPIF